MVLTITKFRREISAETLLHQWKKLNEISLQTTKAYKIKEVVTKAKKIYAKKSSRTKFKTAAKVKKEYMILEKSETKSSKYSGDDSQSKEILPPYVNLP